MINKIFTRLSILIACTFLFSSCGSVSISQKRYSNGLNISWFGGKDDAKPKTVKVSVRNSSEPAKAEKLDNPVVGDVAVVEENEVASNNDVATSVENSMTGTNKEVTAIQAVQTVNKKVTKRALKAAVKDIKTQIRSVVNQEQLSPTSVDQTHSSGLSTIGWILIILGLIVLLLASILGGLLMMLVGLLFVISG